MSDQTQGNGNEERKFKAKSAVSIFGAPVSWVALFGALIGAFSIVPFIFYVSGGGMMSAGMGIFAPISGILLGPWAGFVAGMVGGVIGMMISPAAYPLGFLDVLLSGGLLPLAWGLMQPRYHKLLLLLYPLSVACLFFIPYYLPGEAAGYSGLTQPTWAYAHYWAWLALVLMIFGAKWIWRLIESDKVAPHVIGLGLNFYLAMCIWIPHWDWPYFLLLKFPYEAALTSLVFHWLNPIIPMLGAGTAISYFLIRAVRKGNLRVIPSSWIEGFNFKLEV